jgi:hypothetical protein
VAPCGEIIVFGVSLKASAESGGYSPGPNCLSITSLFSLKLFSQCLTVPFNFDFSSFLPLNSSSLQSIPPSSTLNANKAMIESQSGPEHRTPDPKLHFEDERDRNGDAVQQFGFTQVRRPGMNATKAHSLMASGDAVTGNDDVGKGFMRFC